MKNIILGMLGAALTIYLVVFGLSVYSVSTRKNEMENCISQVLEQNLLQYYGGACTDEEARVAVVQDLSTRLQADSKVIINVPVCDMQTGILSATIKEEFYLPMGTKKTVSCSKTVLAEEEIIEVETQE